MITKVPRGCTMGLFTLCTRALRTALSPRATSASQKPWARFLEFYRSTYPVLKPTHQNLARWGDNYAYHIGDLSSVVLPGREIDIKPLKYRLWAEALFETTNSERPRLRQPVLLWVRAWRKDDIGVWKEFGPTRLSFLEYLLIGLANVLFPGKILNREGHNGGA